MIPGFPSGYQVYYYIAAQDSASSMVSSSPPGCRGMNPPGTVPPSNLYSYYILDNFSICSKNLPKDIPPKQIIYDSIFVDLPKLIMDIDVEVSINHTNDTDLYVMLTRSGFGQTNMSIRNGGSGDNYVNTIFDDEADTLIANGTPPFTGRYKPEYSLDKYDNSSTYGYWVLKILNMSDSITGQLVDWCVNISYFNPIGIVGSQVPARFSLSQNYPNPFNASTKISYEIPENGNVKLIIYDLLGREVSVLVNSELIAGKYEAVWNAENNASGIYFYRIAYKDFVQTKKMVLVK
jgi:subtilisin-like proprotein convertase family protein